MRAISYKAALQWIVANDDTEWLPEGPISVTATLVADIYGKDEDVVRRDLVRAVGYAAADDTD